jgi:hypothetical protein
VRLSQCNQLPGGEKQGTTNREATLLVLNSGLPGCVSFTLIPPMMGHVRKGMYSVDVAAVFLYGCSVVGRPASTPTIRLHTVSTQPSPRGFQSPISARDVLHWSRKHSNATGTSSSYKRRLRPEFVPFSRVLRCQCRPPFVDQPGVMVISGEKGALKRADSQDKEQET